MKKILLSSLVLFTFSSSCYGEEYTDEINAVADGAAKIVDAVKGNQTRAEIKMRGSIIDNRAKNDRTLQYNSSSGVNFNGGNVDMSDSDVRNDTDNRESVQWNSPSGVQF
jgi:hypothetical protein